MKFNLDEYEKKAIAIPSFASIIPILVLSHFYLYSKIQGFILFVLGIEILGLLSSSAALTFLFMQICRFFGKQVETILFKDGLYMPTTNFLLYSDNKYSREFKDRMRVKIKKDFGLTTLNTIEENKNEIRARKLIFEAVGYIRKNLKKGFLLQKRNIQYGLGRNFVGGSVLVLVFSCLNILIFYKINNVTALLVSTTLLILYGLIFVFGKKIITKLGNDYAEMLCT